MRCPAEVETRIAKLPSLRAVTRRVLQVLTDEHPSTDALLETLRREPELAHAVVQLSSSVGHPLPRPVVDPSQAVAYLGERPLARMAAGLCLAPLWPKPEEDGGWSRDSWRRSVVCGLAAELIAAASGMADARVAFVAGLLCDVGALVLGPLSESRADALREALEDGRTVIEAERDALGIDHPAVGALIVERWMLPQAVRDAVRLHHSPDRTEGLARVAHLADVITAQMGVGLGTEGLARPTSAEAVAKLQIGAERIDALRLLLLDERRRSRELLQLPHTLGR